MSHPHLVKGHFLEKQKKAFARGTQDLDKPGNEPHRAPLISQLRTDRDMKIQGAGFLHKDMKGARCWGPAPLEGSSLWTFLVGHCNPGEPAHTQVWQQVPS